VELINKEFPHIHVVKGKARKLTTQGSIEVSHKAFKEALVTWCNNTRSNDWVYGSYIVQNEVNHWPMRTRGNISPHTLYYGNPPNNSYSTILGAAYSKATTEFGLRLAKKVLTQLAEHQPDVLASQDQIAEMISIGDHLWNLCAREDTPPVESEKLLFAGVIDILKDDFGIQVELTPSMTLFEEDTIGELNQEELVWKAEHLTIMQQQYEWDDSGNEYPSGDPPQELLIYHDTSDDTDNMDKKPAAKATLAVERDDDKGEGIVVLSFLL
jgi:hypothetical protein